MPTRAGPPEPLAARRVLLVDQPDASQAQIRVGAMALKRNDPELLPAQVANTVLGGGFSSKLVEELRVKRSLTYGASSAFVARLTGGDFRISTFSKSPTAVETLALALDVEGGFRRDPIDPKALDKARSYLVGQFPLRLETPDALAARLVEIEFFGLPKDDLETYVPRVAAVTPQIAVRVGGASTCPMPERVAIVVVGKAVGDQGAARSALRHGARRRPHRLRHAHAVSEPRAAALSGRRAGSTSAARRSASTTRSPAPAASRRRRARCGCGACPAGPAPGTS